MGCKTPLGVTEVTKRREYVGLDLRWYFNASSRIGVVAMMRAWTEAEGVIKSARRLRNSRMRVLMDRNSISTEHRIGVNAWVPVLLVPLALMLLLGGGACNRQGANPRIDSPRHAAKPKPKSKPKPKPEPKPLPKSAFQPSVKCPSYGVLKRLAVDPRLGPLRVWGHGTSLGGTRFLAVVVGNVRGANSFRHVQKSAKK